MAESSSLRSGAGSAFHVDGPATEKLHGPNCLRRWNDEAATHNRTQTASMKVACNWLTHVHQVSASRKLLKIPLDMVKYPLWIQKLLYYMIQHEGGRHIDFRQMSIYPRQTTANNCKTAFSLNVVESASDDYSF